MKKFYIFLLSFISAMMTFAQLQVTSNGRTVANGLQSFIYNPTGDGAVSYPLYAGVENAIAHENYGVVGHVTISSNNQIGTYPYNQRQAIGVMGRAEYATDINYGVYGWVTESPVTTKGAAIYGSINNDRLLLNQLYAGVFDGDVKTTGNIYIDGYIYSPNYYSYAMPSLVSNNNSGSSTRLSNAVSSLCNLQVGNFYIEPIQYKTAQASEKDLITTDAKDNVEDPSPVGARLIVDSHKHYGIDAIQLEEIYPDLVRDNKDGTKSINYVEMVPILVQAIKELKTEIEELKCEGGNNVKDDSHMTSAIESSQSQISLLSLGQNKPNPFSNSTTIEVCIPEDVKSAFIYVYDLQGKKVEQMDITVRGRQDIQLNSANLTDGMYLYSLIADGKVVETRRMIVEK